MNKTIKAIIAVILLLAMAVSLVFTAVLMMPEQFDDLYLGELADKYARLRSLDDENKIIVIGGSSVAFGINSQVMEKYLGMPVVNFGLYGPLGTTIMMDLTRGHINEGDIIVLAPETDHQTMSMTFNGEGFWESCDSDFTMLFKVRFHNWGDMLGSFWVYAQKKLQFFRLGKAAPDGVYDHDAFNEYGDIIYERVGTIMPEGYDPTVLIDLDPSVVEDEYIDYMNDFIDYCYRQGAQVYYSWPPMNTLAVQQDEEGILEFATYIRESIHCPVISNITNYILDEGYFYDTNYHVNDVGVYVHTANLIQDLENVIGDGDYIPIERPAPPETNLNPAAGPNGMPMPVGRWQGQQAPPAAGTETQAGVNAPPAGWIDAQGGFIPQGANPNVSLSTPSETESDAEAETTATEEETTVEEPVVEEIAGSSKNADCFTYEAYDEGLLITGVQGDGLTASTLEIPWLIDGQKVIAIGENAFADAKNLKVLYIQSNITRIMQNAFDGCVTLMEIHIDNEDGANILIPGIDLFTDVPKRCKVYIAQENYGSFVANYFWANYLDRLEVE